MENLRKKLVNRINELCNEKNYSYYELAYKSGMPMSTLMHIMDGTSKNPGIWNIYKICVGLDISLKELFDTDDPNEWLAED